MGQYYLICNLDKRQYFYSHAFGDGLKLMEFGLSGGGMMAGLAILLADGNGRGGGDIDNEVENPVIGSWAGDRIVIAGDYADPGKWGEKAPAVGTALKSGNMMKADRVPHWNLYDEAQESFENISAKVVLALAQDGYAKSLLEKRRCWMSEANDANPVSWAREVLGVSDTPKKGAKRGQ